MKDGNRNQDLETQPSADWSGGRDTFKVRSNQLTMCKGLATLPATCLKSAKDIKHKIGFLLQKPESQTVSQKQTNKETKRVVSAAEVEKWKKSFTALMNSEDGREVFAGFLRSEFSEENMEFLNACQEFKQVSAAKMAVKAKLIFDRYVEVDSPKQVNLDATTREETRQNLEASLSASIFDEAERLIHVLLEKDSYRRFLRSRAMQDLCLLSTGHSTGTQQQQKKTAGG
ncbi:Regulator of G-protein signaling 4 [Merluccius polli]|uniref:Regulator of G-protein signaling 4 n=1 Tax=Merluccius polli TaxID=89951 RepID=A0AA47NTC5_MERPO|nr:Regulator of G-protein signaling 4 [Merluccius polli]